MQMKTRCWEFFGPWRSPSERRRATDADRSRPCGAEIARQRRMRTYRGHIANLAPLRTLDPAAFQPDAQCPKDVCDLVLSLALAFNDFHDLLVTHDILNGVWPTDDSTPTPELGEFNGFSYHLFRAHLATLHELLNLLQKNSSLLADRSLAAVVKKLQPKAKIAWSSVVGVATGTNSEASDLTKFLIFARNKVAFHYSRKEIGGGFRTAFVGTGRQPYVSRGNTLATSRFFFADASAEDYMRMKANDLGVPDTFTAAIDLIRDVTFAVHQVVFTFIKMRGFKLKQP
jgi:hypothetical protein